MKKAAYIVLAALLAAGCASKKCAVKTETADVHTESWQQHEDTAATSMTWTATHTVEAKTDSTTETLIFLLADSGSVKVFADGSIVAAGVKSLTKETKARQSERKAANSEDFGIVSTSAGRSESKEAGTVQWNRTDSTEKNQTTQGTAGTSLLGRFLDTTAMMLLFVTAALAYWYIWKYIKSKNS